MVVICSRCKKEFKFPYLLQKHLNNKTICEVVNDTLFKCKFCLKTLSTKKCYNDHVNKCKFSDCYIRKKEIELGIEIEPIYQSTCCRYCNKTYSRNSQLIQHYKSCVKKDEYYKTICGVTNYECKKEDPHTTIQNFTSNNTNINIQNLNVVLVINKFGEENTEYIDKNMILRILQGLRNEGTENMPQLEAIIPQLVRNIHCHPKFKENHNVYMKGPKMSTCRVFDGEKFIDRDALEVSQKIVNKASGVFQDVGFEFKYETPQINHKFIGLGGQNTIRKLENMDGEGESSKQHKKASTRVKSELCKAKNKEVIKLTKREYQRQQKSRDIV
jgi:hypothetical protein